MSHSTPLHVAVLFGGTGAEHFISRLSAASVLTDGCDGSFVPIPVYIDRRGLWYLYHGSAEAIASEAWQPAPEELTPTFPIRLPRESGLYTQDGIRPIDVALPVLHGDGGEDGQIQGLLLSAGIPFVGADIRTSVLCIDKALTKQLAATLGIPTVPSVTVHRDADPLAIKRALKKTFGTPTPALFIKPTSLGSSVGTQYAPSGNVILPALRAAAEFGDILIERYLPHVRELEVAWLDGHLPIVSEVAQICPSGTSYDFSEKYQTHRADIRLPADVPTDVAERVQTYAQQLAQAVGARDLCRVDFFLTEDGALYFNEINTLPGFTKESLYPQLLHRMGFPMPSLVRRLIERAYARGV